MKRIVLGSLLQFLRFEVNDQHLLFPFRKVKIKSTELVTIILWKLSFQELQSKFLQNC